MVGLCLKAPLFITMKIREYLAEQGFGADFRATVGPKRKLTLISEGEPILHFGEEDTRILLSKFPDPNSRESIEFILDLRCFEGTAKDGSPIMIGTTRRNWSLDDFE